METTHEIEEGPSEYELERGKPMPSFEQGMTQRQFILSFARYEDILAVPELSIDLQGFKRVPDVAVFWKQTMKGRKKVIQL